MREAVGRMIYACLMGTTAVVIFSVKPARDMCYLIDVSRIWRRFNRKDAIVARGEIDKNYNNNS